MMSLAESDNLQGLLTNLNIDMSSGYNDDSKIETLVLQLGELSGRYSDLASRYLTLANSKVIEPTKYSIHEVSRENNTNNSVQKSLLDILAVITDQKYLVYI